MYEDPFAFRGIREYTMTDPMKTINWKASAKAGGLMVNTFDSTLTERVMIYLDLQDEGIIRHERLIEEGISVAASVAEKLIARGMEVGLAVNVSEETDSVQRKADVKQSNYVRVEPAAGRSQLTCIERILARRKADEPAMPFVELLAEPAEDAIAVIVSRNTNEVKYALEKSGMPERMAKDGMSVMWVLPYGDDRDELPASGSGLLVYPRKVAGG
jgi:uncharacterized protein (DUF58 family)